MKIFKSDDTLLIDVEVNDSSYRFRELMGKDELNLEFSLPVYLEIPLGCYCSFQNQKYELLQPSNVTVKHRREFEYQVLFEASWGRMRRWVVINRADGSVEFPLTAKPIEHLNQLVWNLNQRDGEGTWTAGDCIDTPEAVISYAFTKCDKALADIATTFNCEWEIVDHTISLHKLEYNKNNPLRLEYGNNNGFRSGVKRTNDGDSLPIGTLYVQGSEKNIDFSSYPGSGKHSKRLLLPRTTSVSFDGEHFSDETGYDAENAMRFVTDENGYSVKRTDSPHGVNTNEESLDLPNIYPSRIGTVSAVKYIYDGDIYTYDELVAIAGLDWDKVQIYIIDSSIPSSLDYWADSVRIAGETMTVIFQNGMLAGKEFDIQKFYKNADEFRLGNRFELVRTEIDGICMPNATYRVYGTGEVQGKDASTYIVFNCALPQSYITDAEKELLREALKYLYSHQDPKFSFTGELDPMWAKRNWLNVGSKIAIGGYVNFVDQSLAPAPEPQDVGVLVRIISVKDFVNNPYCPTIELSTSTQAKSLSTSLRQAESEYVATGEKIDESVQLSKRSFRNALETSHMLEEALESFKGEFSESITPITVRTMSLLVGSENLQFKFIRSFTNLTDAPCPIHWDNNAKKLIYDESYLQHITLGIDDLAPKAGRTYDEYYIWRMKQGESAVLVEELAHTPYYVYAKVPVYNKETAKESQRVGDFIISTVAIGKDDVEGFYHLLCGTLSSETEGERTFARLYGFSEVLPGQITTDSIRTSDGLAYFDLLRKSFKLGDKLTYNLNDSDQLVLNGAFVQTGSGEITTIGAWCGEWDKDRIYRLGDEAWKSVNGVVSTYRYVNSVPSKGHDVTDLSYWIFSAEGVKGEDGKDGQSTFKSIVFKRTNSTPATPDGGSYSSPVPSGWSDGVPEGDAQLWMSTRIFASDGKSPQESAWTTPRPATDTADIDFEYSAVETNPGTPSTKPSNWHNTATASDIWMAVRKCKNGVWGSWEVNKIKGEDGKDGQDGSDGADGVGISSTEVRYQKSTSGTVVPSGAWQTSIPAIGAGEYLWTRLVVTYTNGKTSTSYSVSRNGTNGTNGKDGSPGKDGDDGTDGIGISSYIIDYQEGSNGTTIPQGTWTTRLSDVTVRAGFYLWTRTRVTLTNGTTNTSYSNARQGLDGAKGADGVSPACPYCGNWSSSGVYYGMGSRTDIVFFSKDDYSDGTNLYYVAKTTIGGPIPTGVKPTNTAYWSTFGANFDNIATGFAFIEQLVVRQLNTAGEGSSTKRIVAEGNTLAMYDDSNNKKMSISGENLVPAGESASYTYNYETLVSRSQQMWPQSGDQIEQDGAEHTISVVSGNRVVITTPKVTLTAGDITGRLPISGALTVLLTAFLKYNNNLYHLGTIGGAINPSSSTVNLTVNSQMVTLTLPSGNNKVEMFVRVTLGGQNFYPYGDYYYLNVTTDSWRAEVTYGAQSVDIGANGFRAMFGSSYMFQAFKTGVTDSTIEMLMRAGNYGVKMTSSGLQFLIGGTWYTASRVYDSTISGYVLKLG